MKALLFEANAPRYLAARAVSLVAGSGKAAGIGPLRLADVAPPLLPGPNWYMVKPSLAGICGSDLSTLDGASSRYFEDLVSMPFVPGHEVVGTISAGSAGNDEAMANASLRPGTRVVVEPVLSCVPRGVEPPCAACQAGLTERCEMVAFGHLSPGIQIGYCADTGGGWSMAGLVAHESQLHPLPEEMTDEDAVMVEPAACAIHAARCASVPEGSDVVVIGAGTLGLLVTAALVAFRSPGSITVGARYEHQGALAVELGADRAVRPTELLRAVRRRSSSFVVSRHLSSGADTVFDCVGSAESIAQAISLVRPGGEVVLLGMPAAVRLDLAPLWHREVRLRGAYAYGTERQKGERSSSEEDGRGVRTFELAIALASKARLGRLVSARYPIERFDEAIAHAGSAGRLGAVKVVFDLRRSSVAKGATRRQGDSKGTTP